MFSCVLASVSNFLTALIAVEKKEILGMYFFQYGCAFGGIILLYLSVFISPSLSKLPAQLWRFYKEENTMVRTLQMLEKPI